MNIALIGVTERRLEALGGEREGALRADVFERAEQLQESPDCRSYEAILLCGGFPALAPLCDAAESCMQSGSRAAFAVWLDAGDPLLKHKDALVRYCLSQGIQYWDADSGPADWGELTARLSGAGGEAGKASRGHLAVFQGTTPNIGTTVIAFGSAVKLAQEAAGRIAYVCLNLKSSKLHHYIGADKPSLTLDGVRAELKSGSLTGESLRRRLYGVPESPGLFVLFGNMLREQAEYYTVEDIAFLIRLCREQFDMTIVEVSAYWDNAASFASMLEADSRIFVCADRLASFQEDYSRWAVPMLDALELDRAGCDLVVSQMSGGGYRQHDIRKQTGLNIIGSVRHHPAVAAMADQGRLHELLCGSHPIAAELQGIARMLMHEGRLVRRAGASPASRGWARRLLSSAGR